MFYVETVSYPKSIRNYIEKKNINHDSSITTVKKKL